MCENVSVNEVAEGFVITEPDTERSSNDLDMNGKQSASRTRPVPEDGDNAIELSSAVVDKKAREHPRDDHKRKRQRERRDVTEDSNTLAVTSRSDDRRGVVSGSPKRASPVSPQRNILNNNVRYVHNRFIVLDTPDNSTNLPKSPRTKRGVDNPQMRMAEGADAAFVDDPQISGLADRARGNRRNMAMDASSVTMVGREIEISLTDPENTNMTIHQKKPKSIWKRIYLCLQDNRMKGQEPGELLNDPNEYRVLKKVLNIIFITVGVTLFVAVVISVIYSFIVGDNDPTDVEPPSSTPCSNNVTCSIKS